jgi:peptide/nickel transport system permease protein
MPPRADTTGAVRAASLTVSGAPHLRLVAHRLLITIPVFLGVTLLTFTILDLLPGNAATQLLGIEATPEQVAQLEEELNLNQPAPQRYGAWLGDVVRGDLGKSLASRQPVAALLAERVPVTLELVVYAFVLSLGVAVPAALAAARLPNRFVDRVTLVLSMVGLSAASYVLALVLVLVFAVQLAWFPSIGFTSFGEDPVRNLHSLTLPALAMAIPLMCFYTRFLRGDLLDQVNGADYVLTARAKGIGPWRILIGHAFRNSVFGLLTTVGLNFGTLIGSTVIVEQIFALPGLGQLLLQGINTRDVPVVQAAVLLLTVVTVLANLAVDLLYTVLDPRVKYAHQ